MVAKPRVLGVERDDEGVGLLELEQGPLRPGGSSEDVGEGAVHPLQDRGPQQEPSRVLGLALEHLSKQVVGDRALAARELGDEPLGIRVADERERRQPESGRPPLGPRVEHGDRLVRGRDTRRGEQLARLVQREAQVGSPHLGQLAGEAQAMQPELRVAAGGQHDPEQRRSASEQELELGERLWGVQLVQIVDDEYNRLFQRAELQRRRSTRASRRNPAPGSASR